MFVYLTNQGIAMEVVFNLHVKLQLFFSLLIIMLFVFLLLMGRRMNKEVNVRDHILINMYVIILVCNAMQAL